MERSSLKELSGLLWRERDVLEAILTRLDEENADNAGLFRSISSLELHRAITAREVGVEYGVDDEPTLSELVDRAPVEWAAILRSHLEALRQLATALAGRLDAGATPDDGIGTTQTRRPAIQRSLREFLG